MRSKTSNDNYYLLTMAAIAQEIRYRRGERKTDVVLAAGLPLASFGREKKGFREYLFRKEQPLRFRYEDESYEIRIQDVKLFPQDTQPWLSTRNVFGTSLLFFSQISVAGP